MMAFWFLLLMAFGDGLGDDGSVAFGDGFR